MILDIREMLDAVIPDDGSGYNDHQVFTPLVGVTFTKVVVLRDNIVVNHNLVDLENGQMSINKFVLENDSLRFTLDHMQSCCEEVFIESVVGDLEDLVDSPILEAETVTREIDHSVYLQGYTFYKFSTLKGSVVLRWIGESKGYYAIGVSDDLEVLCSLQ